MEPKSHFTSLNLEMSYIHFQCHKTKVVDHAKAGAEKKKRDVLGILSNNTAAMERNLSLPETNIVQVYT